MLRLRWTRLNQWRSNNTANTTPWAPEYTGRRSDNPLRLPIATATPRGDFVFQSQAEALYNALGSRIDNPGYRQGPTLYQPFTPDTNLDLYYRGGMANLNRQPYPPTRHARFSNSSRKPGGSSSPAANGTDSVYSVRPNRDVAPRRYQRPSLTSPVSLPATFGKRLLVAIQLQLRHNALDLHELRHGYAADAQHSSAADDVQPGFDPDVRPHDVVEQYSR